MMDRTVANQLAIEQPHLTWDQTIGKYSSEYSGQELWRQIINSSQRSNPAVNQSLGVK